MIHRARSSNATIARAQGLRGSMPCLSGRAPKQASGRMARLACSRQRTALANDREIPSTPSDAHNRQQLPRRLPWMQNVGVVVVEQAVGETATVCAWRDCGFLL